MEGLPEELIEIILNNLDYRSQNRFHRVFKKWDNLKIKSDSKFKQNIILFNKNKNCFINNKKYNDALVTEDFTKINFIPMIYIACMGNITWLKYKMNTIKFNDENSVAAKYRRTSTVLSQFAALSGSLECIKYLYDLNFKWDIIVYQNIILSGSLECFKFAIEKGCPRCDFIILIIISRRSLEFLKYAIEIDFIRLTKTLCKDIAMKGDLKCLKYVRELNCPWDIYTSFNAALSGSYECLKYVIENGGLYNESVYACAADGKSLKCIKYLKDIGCPWSTRVTMKATVNNCSEILEFLLESGCPCNINECLTLSVGYKCRDILISYSK
jgi:hypothetical protein